MNHSDAHWVAPGMGDSGLFLNEFANIFQYETLPEILNSPCEDMTP